jgi:hypothetical protein
MIMCKSGLSELFLGKKITNFQSSFVSPQKVTRFSWQFPAWGKWGVGETLMIRHFVRWSSLQKIEKLLFGCTICFWCYSFSSTRQSSQSEFCRLSSAYTPSTQGVTGVTVLLNTAAVQHLCLRSSRVATSLHRWPVSSTPL